MTASPKPTAVPSPSGNEGHLGHAPPARRLGTGGDLAESPTGNGDKLGKNRGRGLPKAGKFGPGEEVRRSLLRGAVDTTPSTAAGSVREDHDDGLGKGRTWL